jgi:flavin reductase (DIM6/NTAB) family NADH-FMN oxidoreductase RutF
MRGEVAVSDAKWLLEPGCVVLVTSGSMERPNVMTFSWQTPIQGWRPERGSGPDRIPPEPCLVLLSINRARYTYELIREIPELVVNVPGVGLVNAVHGAGSASGRNMNKFEKLYLTPAPSKLVRPPAVAECASSLECAIRRFIPVGSHDLLVCEVLRADADPDLFRGGWIPERARTLHYLGGRSYGVLERRVEAGEGGVR